MREVNKYIGQIKWYYDKLKDANYGFIHHPKLGDIFFHKNSIDEGQDMDLFRENEIVVFFSQESERHEGKLEAIKVNLLTAETDLIFLVSHVLSILAEKNQNYGNRLFFNPILSKLISLIENSPENKIAEFFEYCQNHINNYFKDAKVVDIVYLKEVLKTYKSLFSLNYKLITTLVESKVSIEVAHELWLSGLIETCQVDLIASTMFSASRQTTQVIFSKCSGEDKVNIFSKILSDFKNADSAQLLLMVKELLTLSKEFAPEQHDEILGKAISICSDYLKLELWLEDFHQNLDFNTFKIYVAALTPEKQKKFVKKVLKYIHESKTSISIGELVSLNIVDYEANKHLNQAENVRLDYSTSIILHVISELQKKAFIESKKSGKEAQKKIYDIILKKIQGPEDVLQITGFFDECAGRCKVTVFTKENEQGEVIERTLSYRRDEQKKPKLHPICDGRKAINQATNEPLLDDESQSEYWWCANQKCFKPSRELHNSSDWEKYSLLDFLTILNVDFRVVDLEIYLNIINKANRFLKHLKCRECNHILYPMGKTQYAFYGVNDFCCKTETCSEKGRKIYLSHCLNSLCEMEIDSRDCVKCRPSGHDSDSCGWYICNFCHACCNGKQLQKRKQVYDEILHKEYKCHIEGHRDLGVISCNKCGDKMESTEKNIEEYERILEWFITNKDISNRIHKSGKNKFDKWWFVIKRGKESLEAFREKLNKYYQLGFQIPDHGIDKDLQLISEPIDLKKHNEDILVCKECGNILDLSRDPERTRAIKQFHNVKFPK